MKLSVHLATWNGEKYIPYLFESLRKQTFRDWFLYIIDNGSTDETVAAIKKELENFPVGYKIIENKENIGFAPAHNQAFCDADSEYFLLLNQDMYLEPDCLEKMVKFLDKHQDTAAVTPRLMKWNFASICHSREGGNPVIDCHPDEGQDLCRFDNRTEMLKQVQHDSVDSRLRGNDSCVLGMTNVVDSLGLKIFRNRRVIEQCTGHDWDELKKKITSSNLEVFGVSGALPMYRRSMIKEVVFDDGTFLGESYHSYKEDVDLAYRLAASGYKSYVLLDTAAYHDRSGAGPKEIDDKSAMTNKQKQSEWVKYNSYKNHLSTLYKNEYWQNFMLDLPWILWYETKKLFYYLLLDRRVLAGLMEIWNGRQQLVDSRRQVLKMRKANWKEVRKWWI